MLRSGIPNDGVLTQVGLGYVFPVTGLYIWEMRDRTIFAKDRGLVTGSTKDCLIRGVGPILSELAITLVTITIMVSDTNLYGWVLL